MSRFSKSSSGQSRRWALSLAILLSMAAVMMALPLYGKRAAPKPVPPVTVGSIQYSAPNSPDVMGYVVATEVGTGREVWRVRIYRVFYNPFLETDVQDVHITSLVVSGNTLLITNEDGGKYMLDLASRKVTKSK